MPYYEFSPDPKELLDSSKDVACEALDHLEQASALASEGESNGNPSTLRRWIAELKTIEEQCDELEGFGVVMLLERWYPGGLIKIEWAGYDEPQCFSTGFQAATSWISTFLDAVDYQRSLNDYDSTAVFNTRKEFQITGQQAVEIRERVINEWRGALDRVTASGVPAGLAGEASPYQALVSLVFSRLNESDRIVLKAITELRQGKAVAPTNGDIANRAGLPDQGTKECTGALFRHGLLDRGPTGRGSVLSEFGEAVATLVWTDNGSS